MTNIVRNIMQICVGPYALYQVVQLEDFKNQWHASTPEDRQAVLVVSDCPHPDVVDLLSATKGPILIACDSFEHIVRYVMRSRGMDFAPAVRFATQVVCALDCLKQTPNVFRVTPEHYGQDLTGFTASLIEFSGISCSDAQFESLRQGLAIGRIGQHESFGEYVERHFPHFGGELNDFEISSSQRAAMDRLGEDYGALIDGGSFTEAAWPVGLFLDWDHPGRFLDRTIELLGPARFIVCGPYLHLPIGRWRMSIEIEINECLSNNVIGADVFSGRILSAATMDLPPEGFYCFPLDFDVVNPLLPVELRVQLLTGAIEGNFRLLRVSLSRTGTSETLAPAA